jgi:hypothetical protein
MTKRGRATKKLLIVIALLNVIDAVLTWFLVQQGMAQEYNFVPAWLIDQGPLTFFAVKIGAVSGALIYMGVRLTDKTAHKYFYVVLGIAIAYGLIITLLSSIPITFWYLYS